MLRKAEPTLMTIAAPVLPNVEKGRADIDDDPGARLLDQRLRRLHIHRVERMGLDFAIHLEGILLADGCNDRLALRKRARGDVDVAEHIVVLCAFVRDDLRHAAGADDEDIFLHCGTEPPFSFGFALRSLTRGLPRNPRR